MTGRFRTYLAAAIRWGICLAALSWIVHQADFARIAQIWKDADKRLLLVSLAVFGPAPMLLGVRLKWLLGVHGIHLGLWKAIKVTFAGNFIITALPGGTAGGDSVKAWYVARETADKHEAVTTVFFDRLIGVVGLLLLSGAVVLINWGNPAFTRYGRPIGVFAVAFFVGAAMYYSQTVRRLFRLDALIARLPFAAHLQRIDRAVLEFRRTPLRVAAAIAITFVLQGISILALYFGGWALGVIGEHPLQSLPVYLAYIPITFLGGALPIGVMELIYPQLFFQAAGLGSWDAAVLLSLYSRVMQLVWALPGGLVVLRSRPPREAVTDPLEPAAGTEPLASTSTPEEHQPCSASPKR